MKIVACQRGERDFSNLGVITAIVDQYGACEESLQLADQSLSGKRVAFSQGQQQGGLLSYGYDREILDETGRVVRRLGPTQNSIARFNGHPGWWCPTTTGTSRRCGERALRLRTGHRAKREVAHTVSSETRRQLPPPSSCRRTRWTSGCETSKRRAATRLDRSGSAPPSLVPWRRFRRVECGGHGIPFLSSNRSLREPQLRENCRGTDQPDRSSLESPPPIDSVGSG